MESLPIILLAFANNHTEETEKLKYLRKEHNKIEEILTKAEKKRLCELIVLPFATLETILDKLQDESINDRIAIFHFSGHADTSQLMLEEEQGDAQVVNGKVFNYFLRHAKALRLVFLNACASEKQARGLQRKNKVPLVIGTTESVRDDIACEIAVSFYEGLAKGLSLGDAWEDAENNVLATHSETSSFRDIKKEDQSGDINLWKLYVREGCETVKRESLPSLARNPLYNLALPEEYYHRLPFMPFLGIHRFEERHAPLFFGRGREILNLYQLVKGSCPIILFYGESGTGKSSLLEAGLLPRIKGEYCVVPVRRSPGYGLRGNLSEALAQYCTNSELSLREQWFAVEMQQTKPLLIILDQAEEAFTKPHTDGIEEEWTALLNELKQIFDHHDTSRPQGKIILSFRKEYLPDIKRRVAEDYKLPRREMFLEQLTRDGIIEAIEGITKNPETKQAYRLEIEKNLPGFIADNLLADNKSPISPVLQILLKRLWDEGQDRYFFSRERYLAIESKGIHLDDFLQEKLEALSKEGYAKLVDKGLVLNLLHDHITLIGTANTLTQEDIERRYPGQKEILPALLQKLVDHYLLFRFNSIDKDTKQSVIYYSLCHDTLAPVVLQIFRSSDRPGQRALRFLESKQHDIAQGVASFKDTDDIAALEAGRPFMRAWTPGEDAALRRGKEALAAQVAREAAMRRSNFDSALDRIKGAILRLDYNLAFQATRNALDLNYGQAVLAPLLEEIGFVFHASGQQTQANEAFRELAKLGLPQYMPIIGTLPVVLRKTSFSSLLDTLQQIPDGAATLIKARYFPKMIYVEGGDFMMGYNESDERLYKQLVHANREIPLHQVNINGFFLQKTPVTYWQYYLFIHQTGLRAPRPGWGRQGDNPAVFVSWMDAIRYCNWQSDRANLQPAYQIEDENVYSIQQSNGYRLPSEAEWEYAARGGKNQHAFLYCGSNDLNEVGWFNKISENRTQPVELKRPNALGLYDLSGNVGEWCADDWHRNYQSAPIDGSVWMNSPRGYDRVIRGGSWVCDAAFCRVAHRYRSEIDERFDNLGFRLARSSQSGG